MELYLKEGKPTYTYNWLGLQRYNRRGDDAFRAGKATIRFEFAYDGGRPGSGGAGVIAVQARKSRKAESSTRSPLLSRLTRAPTSALTRARPSRRLHGTVSKFTGKIHSVTVELK